MKNNLSTAFLIIVVVFLAGYFVQIWLNTSFACEYQEQIVCNQKEYLALQNKKYDAIRVLGKHWKDSAELQKTIQTFKSELHQDSIAWNSGAEAVMKDTKNLLDLHMACIDRQYNSLMLWAAVITILFLIFSFYAIFKLEDTLKQAKDAVKGFEEEANKKIAEVEEKANRLIEKLNDKAKVGTENITKEANKQQEVIQLLSEAQSLSNSAKYKLAIEKYQRAVKVDPKNALIYSSWGNTLSDWGMSIGDSMLFEEGFAMYQKAIELKPDYADAYYNWGVTLCQLGKLKNSSELYEQSCQKYKEAIRLQPKDYEYYCNFGISLYELGNLKREPMLFEQSFQMFEESIKLNSEFASSHNGYAASILTFAELKGDYDSHRAKIEELLLKAEALKEGSGSYNLACLYSLMGEKEKAFKWLEKSLEMNIEEYSRSKYKDDIDFENIKSDPRFIELLDRFYPKGSE